MNTTLRTRTAALAVALAAMLAVGGVVSAVPFTEHSGDVSNDEYDLEVVDPDGLLSEDDVDRAAELAWTTDEVQAQFAGDEDVELTVQALGSRTDVTVTIDGAGDEGLMVDVDLEAGTVTDVAETTVVSAEQAETVDVTAVDGDTFETDGESETSFEVVQTERGLAEDRLDIVDTDDVLSEDERAMVQDLLRTNDSVAESVESFVEMSDAVDSTVDSWNLVVSEYDNPLVDSENVVTVDVTTPATNSAVTVQVALDDEEIRQVAQTFEMSEAGIDVVELDDDAVELVEEDG